MSRRIVLVLGRASGRLALVGGVAVQRSSAFPIPFDASWKDTVSLAVRGFGLSARATGTVLLAPSLMPVRRLPDGAAAGADDAVRGLFFAVPDPLTPMARLAANSVVTQIDRRIVTDIVTLCEDCGLRVARILPQVAVLASVARGRVFAFRDGPVTVTVDDSCRVRRFRGEQPTVPSVGITEIKDSDHTTWADASAIATLSRDVTGLDVRANEKSRSSVGRALMSLALVLGVAAGVGAPVLLPYRRVTRLRATLEHRQAELRARRMEAEEQERALADLAALTAFTMQAPITLRLAQVARALPPDAYASNLEIDSTRVVMTIRGRALGAIPEALRSELACNPVDVLGSVSQEPAKAMHGITQRATVQCTLGGSSARSRR